MTQAPMTLHSLKFMRVLRNRANQFAATRGPTITMHARRQRRNAKKVVLHIDSQCVTYAHGRLVHRFSPIRFCPAIFHGNFFYCTPPPAGGLLQSSDNRQKQPKPPLDRCGDSHLYMATFLTSITARAACQLLAFFAR